MDDWEEFESWHEDLMAWNAFKTSLKESREKIPMMTCTTLMIKDYPCNRKPPRNLTQNAATIRWSNSERLRYLQVSWSFCWQSNGRVDGFTMCTLSDAYF